MCTCVRTCVQIREDLHTLIGAEERPEVRRDEGASHVMKQLRGVCGQYVLLVNRRVDKEKKEKRYNDCARRGGRTLALHPRHGKEEEGGGPNHSYFDRD